MARAAFGSGAPGGLPPSAPSGFQPARTTTTFALFSSRGVTVPHPVQVYSRAYRTPASPPPTVPVGTAPAPTGPGTTRSGSGATRSERVPGVQRPPAAHPDPARHRRRHHPLPELHRADRAVDRCPRPEPDALGHRLPAAGLDPLPPRRHRRPGPDPVPGACRVAYTANAWNTGPTATVTITNTGKPASFTLNGSACSTA